MIRSRNLLFGVAAAAALGLFFASFSTYDFVQHLDRQVHGVHCSFVPGLTATDASGASGCQATMMSRYSSVLRSALWGGIPISLPAMSVFSFLIFFALACVWTDRVRDRRALGFLVLATALPLGASVVMGAIAFVTLGAACKLCIGIYVASALCAGLAFLAYRRATVTTADPDDPNHPDASAPEDIETFIVGTERTTNGVLALAFLVGVVFVALPIGVYAAVAPAQDTYVTACGVLPDKSDRYDIMVPLDAQQGVEAIEVLDPLCPACRAFEARLESAPQHEALHRQAVLFPLDNTCNWMVNSPIHPGACTVSEAVLCADERANEVLEWAFSRQREIMTAAARNPGAVKEMIGEAFPELKSCVGSSRARAQLNRSLRWAVRNRIQVMTPQLFVDGVRLCDEDVDLGLDYALRVMLDKHATGELPKPTLQPFEPVAAAAAPREEAPANPSEAGESPDEADAPSDDLRDDDLGDDAYGAAPRGGELDEGDEAGVQDGDADEQEPQHAIPEPVDEPNPIHDLDDDGELP